VARQLIFNCWLLGINNNFISPSRIPAWGFAQRQIGLQFYRKEGTAEDHVSRVLKFLTSLPF
jgi:hypothetical protein